MQNSMGKVYRVNYHVQPPEPCRTGRYLQRIMGFTTKVRPEFTKVIYVTGFKLEESEIIECCRELFAGNTDLLNCVNDSSAAFTTEWDFQASWNPTKDEPALTFSPNRHCFWLTPGLIIAIAASAVVMVAIVGIAFPIDFSRRRGQRLQQPMTAFLVWEKTIICKWFLNFCHHIKNVLWSRM